ncbi:MAG: hypothetical protein ABEI74_04520 [Candidatus Pacearchaeota archaeon]
MGHLNEQLKKYIGRNIKKGYTTDTLKWALVNQGYSKSIVEKAVNEYRKEKEQPKGKAPAFKEKPVIKREIYDQNNRIVKVKKKTKWQRILEKLKFR